MRHSWADGLHRFKPEGTIDEWQTLCNICGGCVATPFFARFLAQGTNSEGTDIDDVGEPRSPSSVQQSLTITSYVSCPRDA